jgi:ribosome-associated toxin RatA of RatAB toxin-antitoxin module
VRHVNRSARVPHTALQMFDLVNDVEAYPEFLHWCQEARIERTEGATIEAVLEIGMGGIHKSFRTRNTLSKPEQIEIELVSGPFRRLDGIWRFTDLEEGGSEVTLALEFEIVPSPFGMIFATVFEELARSQMNAFIERAAHIYGTG